MTRAQTEMTDDSLGLTYRLERDYRLNLFHKSNESLTPRRPPKISSFNISYQGRPVVIKDRDGRKVTIWQALFLQDAPEPAVLASSNHVYLTTTGNRSAGAGHSHVTTVANNGAHLTPTNGSMAKMDNPAGPFPRWVWQNGSRLTSLFFVRTTRIHSVAVEPPESHDSPSNNC